MKKDHFTLFPLLAFFVCNSIGTVRPTHEHLAYALTHELRLRIAQYYNTKYNANIIIPATGLNNLNLQNFIHAKDFWYVFKASPAYKNQADTRIMWYVGTDAGHATPVFYLKENGREALFIADSINIYMHDILSSVMCQELSIPLFIVQRPRQKDHQSCFLDALLWGKMVTGKLPDGTYRIPNLVDFLYEHATPINLNMDNETNTTTAAKTPLYSVTQLPVTLLSTAQCSDFIKTYRIPNDDTFISSHGKHKSFDAFLYKHQGPFALDYLRKKGVHIHMHADKFLTRTEIFKKKLGLLIPYIITACTRIDETCKLFFDDMDYLSQTLHEYVFGKDGNNRAALFFCRVGLGYILLRGGFDLISLINKLDA